MGCNVCQAPLEDASANICSSIECRKHWRSLCRACKKRPRTSRKYCSAECRESVIRFGTQKIPRPLCRDFFERGGCDNDRCFYSHDEPTRRKVDVVLSVNPSHAERARAYLQRKWHVLIDLESSIRTAKSIRSGNHSEQMFLLVQVLEENKSTASLLTFLTAIFADVILQRVLQKAFIVADWCTSLQQACANVASDIRSKGSTKCKVIGHPKNIQEEMVQALDNEETDISCDHLEFTSLVFVYTSQDGCYYTAAIDASTGREELKKLFRSPISNLEVSSSPSKAWLKLGEVFDRYNITIPESAMALDVGASPGGWSNFLARRCKQVTAVDPGKLITNAQNIIHLQCKIEDCDFKGQHFEIVVCDMNVPVKDLLGLTIQKLDQLPNYLVLTCKRIKPQGGRKSFDAAVARLIEEVKCMYASVDIQHLMANKETERTLVAWEPTVAKPIVTE